MPKQGEKGLALLLSIEHGHHLLFIKSRIMKKALDDFSLWLKEPIDNKEGQLLTKEFIRLEIIANTVHYAEVFAASLLAMKKYIRFHKFLLEYRVHEITEFYKQIPKRHISYIVKLLQYPALHRIIPNDTKVEVHKSMREISLELNNLSKFYLHWHPVYNAYKHGLRIAVSKPNPYEDFTVLAYPFSNEKLDSIKIRRTDVEIKTALRLCEFMWKILDSTESTFRQSVLQQKKEYTTQIFHRSKH